MSLEADDEERNNDESDVTCVVTTGDPMENESVPFMARSTINTFNGRCDNFILYKCELTVTWRGTDSLVGFVTKKSDEQKKELRWVPRIEGFICPCRVGTTK